MDKINHYLYFQQGRSATMFELDNEEPLPVMTEPIPVSYHYTYSLK